MGWSCAAAASDTMRAWSDACTAQTGQSNVYQVGDDKFFWEVSNKEHDDGAITGTVYKMIPQERSGTSLCRKSGSFRINPDGTVKRAPAFLKAVKVTKRTTSYGIGSGGF